MAIRQQVQTYARTAGAPESSACISSWLSPHHCLSHSAIIKVYTIIEFQCQNMNHELTYSWRSHSLCSNIVFVLAHLKCTLQSIGNWDTAWAFLAKLQLSLLVMSQPLIEVQEQLKFAIRSRMTLLDFHEANFGKLRLIMNVSFQLRHTSSSIMSLWSVCTPLYSAVFDISLLHSHLVFFGFESVDHVNTDCHFSRYCTFRCRRLIPPGLW